MCIFCEYDTERKRERELRLYCMCNASVMFMICYYCCKSVEYNSFSLWFFVVVVVACFDFNIILLLYLFDFCFTFVSRRFDFHFSTKEWTLIFDDGVYFALFCIYLHYYSNYYIHWALISLFMSWLFPLFLFFRGFELDISNVNAFYTICMCKCNRVKDI